MLTPEEYEKSKDPNSCVSKPSDEELDDLVDETPIETGIRYFIMRSVRLPLALAAEVATAVMAMACAWFAWYSLFAFIAEADWLDRLMGNGHQLGWHETILASGAPWWLKLVMVCPPASLVVCVMLLPICWGLVMSLGSPHRYVWNKIPGQVLVRCGSCKKPTEDHWFCDKCRSYRPKRMLTILVLIPNRLLTMVWAIHDAILGLLAL